MTIKAYAAKRPGADLEPFEYEPGALGSHEVDVSVTHCGICHSDLAMIDNDWGMTTYPLVPGHEIIGEVSAVGADVKNVKVGHRVGVGWFVGSCGHCNWCLRGRECLCAQGRPTIVGHHGGWAESVRTHENFAVPIPEEMNSADVGPLLCAGSTCFTPMMQYHVEPWMKAAVIGIGGLGHLAVQYLSAIGCEVTAISSSHDKDEATREFGASRFLATQGTNELKKAANSFDFILSTLAVDVAWEDYFAALRPQGRFVFVGVPPSPVCTPVFPLLQEKSISGGTSGSPTDNQRMLDFSARHGIKPKVEVFPIANINEAVRHVRDGKARFRAVLEF